MSFSLSLTLSMKELSNMVAIELPKIQTSEYESIQETYPLLKVALRHEQGLQELLGYMQQDFTASLLGGGSVSLSCSVFGALLEMGNALRNETI